jgi:hypothetical protein
MQFLFLEETRCHCAGRPGKAKLEIVTAEHGAGSYNVYDIDLDELAVKRLGGRRDIAPQAS